MKFPWWGSDNHEKKTDERRIETTFGEHDVCYPKQTFLFFSSPSFRPFLFSSARVNNYRVCRECVYFKHITGTICLEKKKKKKKREKRRVVVVYI